MAARRRPKARGSELERRLAEVERGVRLALARAQAELAKEEAKLARTVKDAEAKLAARERALARALRAAVRGAEAKARAEERKLESLAQRGTFGSVDRLGPARRKPARKRRGR
jgi:hypothetical protein